MPAKKKSYLEFYRDPRWQKKRLEVMERDKFTCVECGNEDRTLNVHHCFYENGKMPWDYPLSSLVTMCEECHESERDAIKGERAFLLETLGRLGFTSSDLDYLSHRLWTIAVSPLTDSLNIHSGKAAVFSALQKCTERHR